MQCSQFAFICTYVYIHIYPLHFNCVGTVSVVSSTTWYWSDQEAVKRSCACESRNGAGAIWYWSDQKARTGLYLIS